MSPGSDHSAWSGTPKSARDAGGAPHTIQPIVAPSENRRKGLDPRAVATRNGALDRRDPSNPRARDAGQTHLNREGFGRLRDRPIAPRPEVLPCPRRPVLPSSTISPPSSTPAWSAPGSISCSVILAIAVCAIVCGADSFVEMEEFGDAKREWLATFLDLRSGIPSHDTFTRLFAALDPEAFCRCFLAWVQATVAHTDGSVVAIDGKIARRSPDRGVGKAAIDMVSAWASANGVVLGQRATDEKSNEITAIPALLDLLLLKGCIVTIDAMGCQTDIATKIVDRGADYVLALKENHDTLYREAEHLFSDADEAGTGGWRSGATARSATRRRSRTSTRRENGRGYAPSGWSRRSGGCKGR